MKQKIFRAKETFEPLYNIGDRFLIVEIFNNPDLLPIRARRLRDGCEYGFEYNELEEIN